MTTTVSFATQSPSLNSTLELKRYTLATPGGHWLKEVTANAAAIAPLLRCGWTGVDVDDTERGYAK